VREYHALHKWDAGGTPSQAMELQEMGVDGQGIRETGGSAADRIFFMKYPLPFLQQKISNSRLVQVYMSKQPVMDAQKVLEYQYIISETLYKTYIREANDVVKLPTRQMSPSKTQKMSGGSMIFRGASALECEVTETPEFDTVTDEIRRWSSLSEDECQRFVEDGVLNEFEMMWQLRVLFPLHFFVFKQTASHLTAEANVEQVFSRVGQLSEVNLDPDTLTDISGIDNG
jgi:hypothetical protein